jgi:hypothetical protein
MTLREYRLARIQLRRRLNATARRLGFRNWAEWTAHVD